MIETPTLFILGAGASFPYGYPLASGLRDAIINDLFSFYDEYRENPGNNKILTTKFCDAFRYSPDPMIDYFLNTRRDFKGVGKEAIFLTIANAEKKVMNKHYGFQNKKDDWARFLLYEMVKTIDINELNNFHNNQVRFITFNYDRSLEFILSEGLKNKFGIKKQEV